MKKTKKPDKPLVEWEVEGRYETEFEGTVYASSEEEAKEKIRQLIDGAVGNAVIVCGDSIDVDSCEAQMEDICVFCGKRDRALPKKDIEILTKCMPSLEFEDNVKLGVPKPQGNYACRKCLDPELKLRGKEAKTRSILRERFPWHSEQHK